ncbi:MAG: DUF1801 domain-containing protein [Flavobacteriales bacterium]|jgi:uncharacterized protein YdhG (YjbR/CyaY superfamily)
MTIRKAHPSATINDYHQLFPPAVKQQLEQLRTAIIQAAPQATEVISYGMPAFKQHKVLVYYAAYKAHIGLYPTPHAISAFQKELTKYATSKGAVQFPLDKPLPLALIQKIVRFRVKEDTSKAASFDKTKIGPMVGSDIVTYHKRLEKAGRLMCEKLALIISTGLRKAEGKVWHGHPVWFLDGNPIVGYSKQKPGIRLMFWSGADFGEPGLNVVGGKFKDASIFYNDAADITVKDVKRWLKKAKTIQWDYKNIVKRKGKLERL